MPNIVTANLMRLPLPHPWLLRRANVARILDASKPDVILFQETTETYERYLAEHLAGPWRISSDHVNCPTFYRSDLYKAVDSRAFTLKGTERNRYGSGAILEDLATGERFCVVSWHPSSNKERNAAADRIKQAEQLWGKLTAWGVTTLPLIVGGDTNDTRRATDSTGVARVMASHGLIDALDAVPADKFIQRDYKTSTGWRKPAKGVPIDRFYCSKEWAQLSAENINTLTAADHNFVRLTVHLGAVPVPVMVTMYVRALGDPVWKEPPFEVWNRTASGEFGDKRRAPGYPIDGVVTTHPKVPGTFLRTEFGNFYRLEYLTEVAPT